MVSYADDYETSQSLGGCDLRNCRHFRGLLGGPAEWCLTQMTMGPRRPWGAAICESVATFVGSWEAQPSGVGCHADPVETSRRLWGLRSAQLSPLSWAPGRPSGVVSYADQNEASPSLGAANCETVATFVGPWGSSGLLSYADQNEASPTLKGPRTVKLTPRSWAPGGSS